jgi:predicted dehydrogenase
VRLDSEARKKVRVGTPDCVQVLTTHDDGARGAIQLSGVIWHDARLEIALYGSDGTLIYDLLRDEIKGAKRSDRELKKMKVPEKLRGGWQVEADFIAAIRGERPVTHTDFATGVSYMQFTEAVARSSRHQMPVMLPLREFSNPSL